MATTQQPPGILLQSIDSNNSQLILENQANQTQIEQNRRKNQEEEGLKVKIVLPKIKLIDRLNPQNPADRALAFSLRMLDKKKTGQFRMFGSNKKNSHDPRDILVGQVSRVIENQNYILNHSHLRQGHYATIQTTPRKQLQPTLLPKLPLEQRKKIIKKEIEILNKSKLLTIHYQEKKIVINILMSVIERSVDLYLKKSRFYYKPAPKKISVALAEFMEKNERGLRKKGLSLSRVIDISIPNAHVEEEGSYKSSGEDSDDQQSNESELSKEKSGSSKEQDENEEQASENSEGEKDDESKQQDQEQQNKQQEKDQSSSQQQAQQAKQN